MINQDNSAIERIFIRRARIRLVPFLVVGIFAASAGQSVSCHRNIYPGAGIVSKDVDVAKPEPGLIRSILFDIGTSDCVSIYYHNRPEIESIDKTDGFIISLIGEKAIEFISKIDNLYKTEPIYGIFGHPPNCNCVANNFKGWVIKFFRGKQMTVEALTTDGEKMYLYSQALLRTVHDKNMTYETSTLSVKANRDFRDHFVEILKLNNIEGRTLQWHRFNNNDMK